MGTKRKPNKPVRPSPMTIRLPDDLREEIGVAAEEQETNDSTVVRQVLRGWFRKRRNPDLESERQNG